MNAYRVEDYTATVIFRFTGYGSDAQAEEIIDRIGRELRLLKRGSDARVVACAVDREGDRHESPSWLEALTDLIAPDEAADG